MHCCQAKTMLNAVPSIGNKFKIIRLQLFAKKTFFYTILLWKANRDSFFLSTIASE